MNTGMDNGASANKQVKLPDLVPLPGSEREPARNFVLAPPAARQERPEALREEPLEVSVFVRRRSAVPDSALAGGTAPGLLAEYGASNEDMDLVKETLEGLGVTITEANAAKRRLRVRGPAGLLAGIFGTTLELAADPGTNSSGTYRHRTGGLSVPAALEGVVTAVLGLDNRAQARTQFHISPAASASISYTPPQLGVIYEFPEGADGSGQTVAIIELGGGFDQGDLDAYFAGLGITSPTVTAVSVDGAVNVPGQDPQGADGEVLLDIQVVGALAPGAAIKVYFAPNTDAGFADAIVQATHDTPTPAVISVSWGQSEDEWTEQARQTMDSAFVDAALLGVSVTVAAGDNGSADATADGRNHADFPASSPHALSCGGTRLLANPATGHVSSEVVWNDATNSATGGGVSDAFPLPTWQQHVRVSAGTKPLQIPTGRGVPDVAAVADPQTGYQVRVDGQDMVIGGTSAVAPLWAALIARLAQSAGHGLGLLHPVLYANAAPGQAAPGFRDITNGNNGSYNATPGWDACTGLGVPKGVELGKLFTGNQDGGQA
ncbi:S53 family peptidase [Arthrobacter sp. E3]|uniref:S53 family peptidase n=1 Tax=Arthrobacter sp. E3 TaxID=517402 RepID=UPI001FFDE02A|nr:S53 family peptidase [Arthrobacter sp. E3]